MQAAWLLGALVVPQLLGFSHGAQGAEREWEGGWVSAQKEEQEREALMLKVSWGVLDSVGELWAWGQGYYARVREMGMGHEGEGGFTEGTLGQSASLEPERGGWGM